MNRFTASDGVPIAYALDDYTDPWQPAQTVSSCMQRWAALCVSTPGLRIWHVTFVWHALICAATAKPRWRIPPP